MSPLMPVATVLAPTIASISGLQAALDLKQNLAYQIPRCQAIRSSTFQSVANATLTAMIFDNADTYDTDNMHDPAGANPSRMIANTAGVYMLSTTIVFTANATGLRGVGFRLNGNDVQAFDLQNTIPAVTQHVASSCVIVPLAAAEYAEVLVYQTSTAALNVGSNDSLASVMTKFTAARIGSL